MPVLLKVILTLMINNMCRYFASQARLSHYFVICSSLMLKCEQVDYKLKFMIRLDNSGVIVLIPTFYYGYETFVFIKLVFISESSSYTYFILFRFLR